MAWADMVGASGGNILGQVGSFIEASKTQKEKKAWQRYNNAMLNIQNAQNQNALTINERMAAERSSIMGFQIRKSEYLTSASVEASAAASGTIGRSVNLALLDVHRNAAVADERRLRDLDYQYLQTDAQRRNSAMAVALKTDYATIPSPNPLSYALDFGVSMAKEYKK